jgi:hypothetical protein
MRSAPPPGARPARATVAARRRAARARKALEELVEGRGATRAGGVAAREGCAFDGPATQTRVDADAAVTFARSTVVMRGVRRERSNARTRVRRGFISRTKK